MRKLLKRYVLWTYGVFYCFIIAIGIAQLVFKAKTFAEVLQVISAWTATFVFIAMFHKIYPKDNPIQYIKRQFSERIKISTVLSIILLQFLIFLGCILFSSYIRNVSIKSLTVTSLITWLMTFGNNLIRGPLGEEIGWRGFVLNELQKKFSQLKSAIIVGLAWGFWHTPLWFVSGYSGIQLLEYIACFLIYILAASVIITGFYNLNHNLLIPIMIHQLFNYFLAMQTGDALQNIMVTSLLYLIAAVFFVLINYKKCLYGKNLA